MNYLFSTKTNAFYPLELASRYKKSGSLPDDALEVSESVFNEFAGAPPVGKARGANEDGQPCWVTLDPDPVDVRKAAAINWIDATADRIRASDRSIGQYLDAEYQLVAQALADYRNNPDAEVPESIQSYATAEGLGVEDAAQQIAEAAAHAEDLLQNVRRIRLTGKAAIRDAADDADMMETVQPFIDQLEALVTV
ncbi:hypothetical protein GCM10010082_06000 [Kushneria pakistanensis]|uniref:Phage tail protein n=1 Tax=Kushneria pakistanensis TaxID=1508770 RepID=A0ABQ3FBR7_9GAMM|nr:tail fiber assembly protein [Kushneria pakistanensis]GHC17566.1 hypothetical protein GCM10010082_06000 [Kushneria pakistanensis]